MQVVFKGQGILVPLGVFVKDPIISEEFRRLDKISEHSKMCDFGDIGILQSFTRYSLLASCQLTL